MGQWFSTFAYRAQFSLYIHSVLLDDVLDLVEASCLADDLATDTFHAQLVWRVNLAVIWCTQIGFLIEVDRTKAISFVEVELGLLIIWSIGALQAAQCKREL